MNLKYITKLDEKPIFNHGFIELWDLSHANDNELARIEAVSTIAAECWGSSPKDRVKLYNRLKTESMGLPSSAFEFVNCSNTYGYNNFIDVSLRNIARLGDVAGYSDKEDIKWQRENIATFRMRLPIFIIRQIMRHRNFAYQELSRRISVHDKLEFFGLDDLLVDGRLFTDIVIDAYCNAIEDGKRPEIARAVFPVGMFSNLWMQGSVASWKNYFLLRTDKHAQLEHRQVAYEMLFLLEKYQPELYEKVVPETAFSVFNEEDT